MKVVYIAGPFTAKTPWGIVENVRRAELLALEVWRLGAVAVCPHLNSANFFGAADEAVFLEGYRELVRRCDAVLLVEGWEESSGTQAEVAEAQAADLPVFEHVAGVAAWMHLT